MRAHSRMAQDCSAHVVISLSSHLLLSHVSPVLAPAVPARSLRDHFRPRPYRLWRPQLPAELSRPESAGQAYSAQGRAVWLPGQVPSPQVMSPRSSTRSLLWTMTRRSSTIRTTVSPTSRKPRTRTLANSVFTQCWNPLFCTFLIGDFVPQRESKESMQSGNHCKTDREREERENFVISVAGSMSMKSRQNSIGSHSLQTHRDFYSDERDLRGHLERRAQQATLGENSNSETIKLDWVRHGDPQFLERRNSEYALSESQRELESQRLQLLEDI